MTSGGVTRGVSSASFAPSPHCAASASTPATPTPSDLVRARLLDAVLVSIARVGVSKTTLDDVAREAGVSRATLYRYFPGKSALIDETVTRELAALATTVALAVDDLDDLEDALTVGMVTAADELLAHEALQAVLAVEPELLLRFLTFERGSELLRRAARALAPILTPFLPEERTERAAEWVVRVFLSYACSPADRLSLTDGEAVRMLVHDFVAPGLRPFQTVGGRAR